MPRPICALIDLAAMARNLSQVRAAAPQARVWAVVKANAYGHGIEAATQGFADADGLALLDFREAQRARAAGWQKPILMLEGAFEQHDLETSLTLGLDLVVHDLSGLALLESYAALPGKRLGRVWIKINTGMNRLGFRPHADQRSLEDVIKRFAALRTQGHCGALGLMTHFARADDDAGIGAAMPIWETVKVLASRYGIEETSLANSAASLRFHGAQGHWIRPGVALYGATPFGGPGAGTPSARQLQLEPAMGLYSRLIAVQALLAGDEVGYGGNFVAAKAMRIGIVACGYADGYPRIAPSGSPVLVDGQRCLTVGRVSMDMLAVDLEPCPAAKVGSEVELWGRRLPIDEVANRAQTIGYEMMCALAPRVPTETGPLRGY